MACGGFRVARAVIRPCRRREDGNLPAAPALSGAGRPSPQPASIERDRAGRVGDTQVVPRGRRRGQAELRTGTPRVGPSGADRNALKPPNAMRTARNREAQNGSGRHGGPVDAKRGGTVVTPGAAHPVPCRRAAGEAGSGRGSVLA